MPDNKDQIPEQTENTPYLRLFLTHILTWGATLSCGFLSYAGMLVISPSLFLCISAFILAAAYEGQVNFGGINKGLRRIFDVHYLKKAIIRRHLEELIEADIQTNSNGASFIKAFNNEKEKVEHFNLITHLTKKEKHDKEKAREQFKKLKEEYPNRIQNAFLKDCYKQMQYVDALSSLHHHEGSPEEIKAAKNKKKAATKKLAELELLVYQHLSQPASLTLEGKALANEIYFKAGLIKFIWLFVLGGGLACGLATLSAMDAAIFSIGVTSLVPGGIILALSICAAAGYTLLLYHSICDFIQDLQPPKNGYLPEWKKFFYKRDNESYLRLTMRCTAAIIGILLAVFGTVATAGTWWIAAKQGGLLLNLSERTAHLLRSVSVFLMALPSLLFEAKNSVDSVEKINRSDYAQLFKNTCRSIKKRWKSDNHFLRFINPFRLVEKCISSTYRSFLFIGHLISIGTMSDRLEHVSAYLSSFLAALNEAFVDVNYLPHGDEHDHNSLMLSALYALIYPITVPLTALAFCYDLLFSWNLSDSYLSIVGRPKPMLHIERIGDSEMHDCALHHDHHHETPSLVEPCLTDWQKSLVEKPSMSEFNIWKKITPTSEALKLNIDLPAKRMACV